MNPAIVTSRSSIWDGNVFGVDVIPANGTAPVFGGPNQTDQPAVRPDLSKAKKFDFSTIEVTWGRIFGGSTIKSTAANSPLIFNPINNGTEAAVSDNFRMRDTGVTPPMEAAGGIAKYLFGHPSESADPSVELTTNAAAVVEAKILAPKIYSTTPHVVSLINAGGTVVVSLNLTQSLINAVFASANTILSQAGFELSQNGTSYWNNNDPDYYDIVSYDPFNLIFGNTINDVANACWTSSLDVIFVRSINSDGIIQGETLIPGNGGLLGDRPAIVLRTEDYSGNAALSSYRGSRSIGRSLAHEVMHYMLKSAEHSNIIWNLLASETQNAATLPYKRDINESQAFSMHASAPLVTAIDG